MEFLSSLLQRLVTILEPYGAPGLLLIAIADSSFLSLPEVNDLALMTLSIANPSRMLVLAAATVTGSIIGCTLLYTVGRKGGEALLMKRFAADRVARVRAWYDKYGMLAIIVPSLLPPPLPFKIFVLCAGAFRISWTKFMIAVGIGRSIRYFTEGVLAVWYGKQAIQLVKDNSGRVGLALATLIVVGTLVFVYSRRRRIPAAVVILPMVTVLLLTGCVRTQVIPAGQRMLKSHPFTREQALAKLEQMSKTVQSLQTPMELQGQAMMGGDTRKTSPPLDGTFIMRRPNQFFLKTSYLLPVFEMRSDGVDYQVYVDHEKHLYKGKEDGPPSKALPGLGDLSNRLINLRPKQILDALVIDVGALLSDPNIAKPAYVSPVVQDRRRYFIVDFTDVSSTSNAWLLQKIWFDLSMENPEVVRRQTFYKDGGIESDTFYSEYKPVGSGNINFPSKVELQFIESETILVIKLDPKNVQMNVEVDPDAFLLSTPTGAKVTIFEPRDLESQQR
jgi:membrane protein YqaA with SNARE-associated domain